MQELSTPKIPENASLSRRRFLAGAVAVPAIVGVPAAVNAAAVDDNYELLTWLLDERAEKVQRHVEADHRFNTIASQPDRPQRDASVGALEMFGHEHLARYYLGGIYKVFGFNSERVSVHDFFEEQIKDAIARAELQPQCVDWPMVKARDYAKVTSALHAQLQARERWEIESGYRAADREVNRLVNELCELEGRIFTLPVLSFRDLRLKLSLAWSEPWVIDEDELRLILSSVSTFANENGRPGRRHDRAAEAGAA